MWRRTLAGMIKTTKSDCQDMTTHDRRVRPSVEPRSVSESVHLGLGSWNIQLKWLAKYLKQFTRRRGGLDLLSALFCRLTGNTAVYLFKCFASYRVLCKNLLLTQNFHFFISDQYFDINTT
jgi:hypothetical protein